MKMLMAVVERANLSAVTKSLMRSGFSVTKISSTGGFLKGASTTLISVVNNEHIEQALDAIRGAVNAHKYQSSSISVEGRSLLQTSSDYPREILMGGATVFVLDVISTHHF